ncbi:keratin, type II cytoskeletal 6A-like [Dendrobates tinctorius]|uniref:keratin, type II cytoskeletal 6A-like n=1 Tax=Dendrobates tinctorius TaxID=92724 RepID=UPI003CCA6033
MKIITLFVLFGLSLPAAESQEFLKNELEVGSLEQKGKELETKWTLLQEEIEQIKRVEPQSGNLESIFLRYINNIRRQVDQLVSDIKGLRNENRIQKRMATKNEPDDVDNALFNKVKVNDLKDKIEFLTAEIELIKRMIEAINVGDVGGHD